METDFQTIRRAHSNLARTRVLADFKTLTRDAEDLLKATAEDVRERVQQARSGLASSLEQPAAACLGMERRSVAQVKATALWVDSTMRKHPYPYLGAAFGVALLLGVWTARK